MIVAFIVAVINVSFSFAHSHKGFRFVFKGKFFKKLLVGGDSVKTETLYAGAVYRRKLGQSEGFARTLGKKL